MGELITGFMEKRLAQLYFERLKTLSLTEAKVWLLSFKKYIQKQLPYKFDNDLFKKEVAKGKKK